MSSDRKSCWPKPLGQRRPRLTASCGSSSSARTRMMRSIAGAGVAMKWARMGHHVKLVSATNGDIGHWQTAGGPLAQRRLKEVMDVGRRLGVSTEVLDIHDGEIMPTLENRRIFTRLIRQWRSEE